MAALIAGKYAGELDPAPLETKLKASAQDINKPRKDAFSGQGQVDAGAAVQQ